MYRSEATNIRSPSTTGEARDEVDGAMPAITEAAPSLATLRALIWVRGE